MTAPGREAAIAADACQVRAVLDRIGDKWAIYVVNRLGQGAQRFSELNRGIDGITARMLTVTLRGLERDGIVTRTIHAAVPPRVDYELTPLGETLLDTIGQLAAWAGAHIGEIEAAREDYDARSCPNDCPEELARRPSPIGRPRGATARQARRPARPPRARTAPPPPGRAVLACPA
jgi:DNA-binding HxlR family transcriptional regulator